MCSALAFGGCSLAFQMGDLDMAERFAAELVGIALRYGLEDFHSWGKAAQDVVALRRGSGIPRLAIDHWRTSGWHVFLSGGDLAGALAEAGHGDAILVDIDGELERAESDLELSIIPELLRLKGELLLVKQSPDPALARRCFMGSVERARAQRALSWELRTAISLALLDRSQGRTSGACQMLERVLGRFTEGFDTADLKRATRLLEDLDSAPN